VPPPPTRSMAETYGCPIRNPAKNTQTCTNLPNQKPTVPTPHPMAYVAAGYPIKKKNNNKNK